MYLACAMAKHHHDDGEGRSRGRCHHDVAQNPKQQFREKFLPVFVWEILFFFFFVSCLLCAQTDLPISEARQTQWPSWGLSMGGRQAAI